MEKNKKESITYRIYINSAAGLSYTGVWANTEEEAKALCKKYNEQDNSPYCKHIYIKIK